MTLTRGVLQGILSEQQLREVRGEISAAHLSALLLFQIAEGLS
jgi:hypothetical protein